MSEFSQNDIKICEELLKQCMTTKPPLVLEEVYADEEGILKCTFSYYYTKKEYFDVGKNRVEKIEDKTQKMIWFDLEKKTLIKIINRDDR